MYARRSKGVRSRENTQCPKMKRQKERELRGKKEDGRILFSPPAEEARKKIEQ